MSDTDSLKKSDQTPSATSAMMEDNMKNFFMKIMLASALLFFLLGMMYWGVNTYLTSKILTIFEAEYNQNKDGLAWTNEQYEEGDDEESKDFFWAKFRANIIKSQLGVFVLLAIVLLFICSTTLTVFDINVETGKLIATTLSCYFCIVLPVYLLLSYTEIFGKIFENTLGFYWVDIGSELRTSMNAIFQTKNSTLGALKEMPYSFSFLITMMSMPNFCEVIKKMKGGEGVLQDTQEGTLDFYISNIRKPKEGEDKSAEDDSEPVDHLPYMKSILTKVISKHTVGEFSWVYFASLVTLFISLTSVL
jgi:hypothetical protein